MWSVCLSALEVYMLQHIPVFKTYLLEDKLVSQGYVKPRLWASYHT